MERYEREYSREDEREYTKTMQKLVVKVYYTVDKFYIERTAARVLGLSEGNAMGFLVEISSETLESLKQNMGIDIEYVKLPEKEDLKVYADDSNYCISSLDAYKLGILNETDYNNYKEDRYYISTALLESLMKDYNIEIKSITNDENKNIQM